jgi:hypothetical protein
MPGLASSLKYSSAPVSSPQQTTFSIPGNARVVSASNFSIAYRRRVRGIVAAC